MPVRLTTKEVFRRLVESGCGFVPLAPYSNSMSPWPGLCRHGRRVTPSLGSIELCGEACSCERADKLRIAKRRYWARLSLDRCGAAKCDRPASKFFEGVAFCTRHYVRKVNYRPWDTPFARNPDRTSDGPTRKQDGLWTYHRMSWAEFLAMLSAQEGRCALCRTELRLDDSRHCHVDHDHACTHHGPRHSCKCCRRGLLCHDCNVCFIAVAERHVELQSELVRCYLGQRPCSNGAGVCSHA